VTFLFEPSGIVFFLKSFIMFASTQQMSPLQDLLVVQKKYWPLF